MAGQIAESIESLMKKADLHYNVQKYKIAEKYYTKILEIDPDNIEALNWRGESRRMLSKYNLGLIDLFRANKLKPNDLEILRALGSTQILLGDLESGIQNLEQSQKIAPFNEITLRQLGFAKSLSGKHEEGLKDLNEAERIDSNHCWTLWRRGVVYRKLGKLRESRNDLQTALALNREDLWILADLADTFREMKLFEKAILQFSSIEEFEAIPVTVDIVKSHIFIDMGDLKEAENCLKRVESRLEEWQDMLHFDEVRKLWEQKNQSILNSVDNLVEDSKREPAKAIEQMTKSINTLQSDFAKATIEMARISSEMAKANLEKVAPALVECEKLYTSESGVGIVVQLKQNVIDLKQENEGCQRRILEVEAINREHERRLQCMICMDNPRDTVVMPCLHFLFCTDCIHYHNKVSNQCPSCRQPITGSLTCKLEGAEPIRKLPEKEKKKEKKKEKEKEKEKPTKEHEKQKEQEKETEKLTNEHEKQTEQEKATEQNVNGKRSLEIIEIKEEGEEDQELGIDNNNNNNESEIGTLRRSKRQKKK